MPMKDGVFRIFIVMNRPLYIVYVGKHSLSNAGISSNTFATQIP